jgi:hypothetical protein
MLPENKEELKEKKFNITKYQQAKNPNKINKKVF